MRDTLRLFRFLKPYWLWATLAPLLMVLEVTHGSAPAVAGRAHRR